MIIQTHFNFSIPKPILFIESMIDECHSEYFIPLIEEGIKHETNCNYVSNVKGKMTSFVYFNENKIFQKLLSSTCEAFKINLPTLELVESWGLKLNEGEYTQLHEHHNIYSGVLYLNDVDTNLELPEINKKVECKKGKFVFFSGMLSHKTKPLVKGTKYAIAFNLQNNVRKNI